MKRKVGSSDEGRDSSGLQRANEWHYALNWLTNYQNQPWDEVPPDT
ncbi:DUF4272 domain-containing protein [Hymenobacter sp. IS2118]|nr:DUF4272 domain-containing protein [Hymenobacter sp. IS2118]